MPWIARANPSWQIFQLTIFETAFVYYWGVKTKRQALMLRGWRMKKTLAMKLLEGKKVPYEVMKYPRGIRDAEAVAATFGVPAAQVLKTLVVPSPEGAPRSVKNMLVMLPADRQLDLKKLAKAMQLKKLKMATHAEAERLTGLQVGGISALALLNRGFTVLLDASATPFEQVMVSAGQRGLNLKLPLADLRRLTGADIVDVSTPTTDAGAPRNPY